jgi:hypothetical protein
MAQTKKKRRTKHRGNAAGVIVTRGKTGRGSTDADPRVDSRAAGRAKKADRFDKPPTWRSALNRAGIATVIFVLALVTFFGQPVVAAVPLAVFMLGIYVPMSYYTDLWLYRRRQGRKTGR